MSQPNFKAMASRWVLVNGVNSINVDIAPHVLNEIGSNGDEVEILFPSRDAAEEYAQVWKLEDYHPTEIIISYTEVK